MSLVRAQKSLGIVGGSPNYEVVKGFDAPEATARTYTYSPDGRLYAYVLPEWCVDFLITSYLAMLIQLIFSVFASFTQKMRNCTGS